MNAPSGNRGKSPSQRLQSLLDDESLSEEGQTQSRFKTGSRMQDPTRIQSGFTQGTTPPGTRQRSSQIPTVFGLLCVILILGVIVFQVDHSARILWNYHGLIIVIGGVAAATLLSFRPEQIRTILHIRRILFYRDSDPDQAIAHMMQIIRCHTQKGVRSAEQDLATVPNDFLRLGLQLALDGTAIDDMVQALSWRLNRLKERDMADARLFRTLALFAPAFGMLGTVAGLIGMLGKLGSQDLDLIGSHMAMALVTTFYGLFLGYLVFRPLAIRIENISARRIAHLNVLMQGILLFQLGRTPATIEESVRSLLHSYQSAEASPYDRSATR